MTIREAVKKYILQHEKLQRLTDNPKSERYTFISDPETIRQQALEEFRTWFTGNSQELENLYRVRDMYGNAKEPWYNGNKYNYFWGIAVGEDEQPIKKVHSALPKKIIQTLSDLVGYPKIEVKNHKDLLEILEKNRFRQLLTQQARPLTCVLGDGCFKINIFNEEYPVIEFVEAQYCDYIYNISNKLIGVIFQSFYKDDKGKDYVLFEIRRVGETINEEDGKPVIKKASIVEYKLFRQDYKDVQEVPLDTLPELAALKDLKQQLEGYDKPLAVPNRYFFDINNKNRGASLFEGKLDIFDDIDETLSIASEVCRLSPPADYIPVDCLEKDAEENPIFPRTFFRRFIKKESTPNGNGELDGKIETTQPQLNFGQYIDRYNSLLMVALTGILSPCSMGIDIAKKDNADAQREKEKTTLYTRNNLIESEMQTIKELITQIYILSTQLKKDQNGNVIGVDFKDVQKLNINVEYEQYATPTFEAKAKILAPLFSTNAISAEMYVNKLYGDELSEKERNEEIEKLKELKSQNDINIDEFEDDPDNKNE